MSARVSVLLVLLAGCCLVAVSLRFKNSMPSETQLTTAPHGHILTNTAVWSPDSQWIVYDVRSDPAGSVFDGTRIERVNVKTKQVEVLYESKNGACVGAATVNPVDGRVVFMHGPEFPTPDWSYSACHREGVIVDPAKPGVGVPLEARDVVPPFTRGALRGGTHLHTWDSTGEWVSYTYEDHILTHGTADGKESNRRTIGFAFPSRTPILVPQSHPRNRTGTHTSEIVVKTVSKPKPGSDDIGRAFEDSWIPFERKITFIGEVVSQDGRKVNELFMFRIINVCPPEEGDSLKGTSTSMPKASEQCYRIRLTRFADIPGHSGLSALPRHWPRAISDCKRIAFLTEDGRLHLWPFPNEAKGLGIKDSAAAAQNSLPLFCTQTGKRDLRVSSAFTWHPDGRHLAAVVDKSVCLIDVETGQVTPLTAPADPPPRPEACVVSPDGGKVAFVRAVGGFNQVFVAEVPAGAVR